MRRLAVAGVAAALLGAAAPARAQQDPSAAAEASAEAALPSRPEDLVAYVTKALRAHDTAAFERLVNWTGARPQRRRLTLYQIRYSFGRPIRSADLEAFPADGLAEAEGRGTLKANMPVTEQLRVVFDEPPGEAGDRPASVFLVGREAGVYRIALLVPTRQGRP
ncbi:hypothetical protein OPKNFCMD_4637 [Methylobacterium crusticola]|uniref:Uncharacterized protein n=1 Tax=Methylobacterium crusticola TaxID=1697972 RepID=A0ABQ4R2I0_9HYPH|nr:hypothetical protein [Methylobacterium crusticola]GJD51878.1 hypothetical protein OPKNFCMD_4637 [Methylobacterium crusticola]